MVVIADAASAPTRIRAKGDFIGGWSVRFNPSQISRCSEHSLRIHPVPNFLPAGWGVRATPIRSSVRRPAAAEPEDHDCDATNDASHKAVSR
ncbi:protein of unknown function [Methylorubrum extorquens]|uniref:Uncharacterized protein n=1 Tax=Methylorubrum extorquens TaxID=408 RepID=A0A2N9AUR3_METEX|nr:protein of unknown function [Methylorubrum extorquens]